MRYRYARWDGTAWRDHAARLRGTRLYSGEDDYTGLAAIDPTDASIVYISTNANPTTGAALTSTRRWPPPLGDLSRQHDQAGQLAVDADDDELDTRQPAPIVVSDGAARKVLLWLRGTYRAYTDYQQQVLMLILAGGGS